MRIKISILLILIIFFQIQVIADTHDLKEFEIKFNEILSDLDSIINNSDNKNEIVQTHFNFIKDKIFSKELSVTFDTALNYDFYGCSSFNVDANNNQNIDISFGQYIVDKYENYPALVYAIIISTFQYAYDYYNTTELFLIGLSNQIEKSYFEIDAMMLEAIFLYTYIQNKKAFGPVEKYLVSDLQNNMAGSATLFKKIDLDLLHKIDNLASIDKSAKKLLQEFINIGNELIKNTSFENKSEWENYCAIVTLKTYIFYSQQVIFDIVHLKNGVNADTFNINDYKENMEILDQLKKIVADKNDYFKYHYKIINKFSDYYQK